MRHPIVIIAVFAIECGLVLTPPVADPLPSLGVTISLPAGATIQDEEAPDADAAPRSVVYQFASDRGVANVTVHSQVAAKAQTLREFAEKLAALPLKRPFVRSEPHKICDGTQEGWLVQSTFDESSTAANGRDVILVAGESGGLRAFASYDAQTLSPELVRALDSLCVRSRVAKTPVLPKTQFEYVQRAYGFSLNAPQDSTVEQLWGYDPTIGASFLVRGRTRGAEAFSVTIGPANGTDLQDIVEHLAPQNEPSASGAFAACNGTQPAWRIASENHDQPADEVIVVTKTRAAMVFIIHDRRDTFATLAFLRSFCVK